MEEKKSFVRSNTDNNTGSQFVLQSPLESSHSIKVSLEAISRGEAGLNARRESLLRRVPNSYEWVILPKGSVEIVDLAYISAAVNHEFALLHTKNHDILYHGDSMECPMENDDLLFEMMAEQKVILIAHSHPDIGTIVPSDGDRRFLRSINQEKSIIISWITGKQIEFYADRFKS